MAQRQIVQLVDDITGKEIPDGEGENIEFTYQGTVYTIDLSAKNAAKYHETMDFYVTHAQRVGKARGNVTPLRRGRKNEEVDTQAVRAWAASNGYQISPRGRIRGEILDAYREAMA